MSLASDAAATVLTDLDINREEALRAVDLAYPEEKDDLRRDLEAHPVRKAMDILLDSLPDADAVMILSDILFARDIPYVIWTHDDFVAEIKANWDIPANLWHLIASRAREQARVPLSEQRAAEVMAEAIDGVWHDWKLSNPQENYKLRLRNPDNRAEVRALFRIGFNADDAHSTLLRESPEFKGWDVVSVSLA